MAMPMAWLHLCVSSSPFPSFSLHAVQCWVSVCSSGEAFSGLTELPATTEGSRREAAPREDTRQNCGPYASWRSGSLFNFCTGVV